MYRYNYFVLSRSNNVWTISLRIKHRLRNKPNVSIRSVDSKMNNLPFIIKKTMEFIVCLLVWFMGIVPALYMYPNFKWAGIWMLLGSLLLCTSFYSKDIIERYNFNAFWFNFFMFITSIIITGTFLLALPFLTVRL